MKSKDDIQVYVRTSSTSSLDEFMGIVEIDVPAEVVCMVMLDISNHKRWMSDCKESRRVQDLVGNFNQVPNVKRLHLVQYYVIDVPWPLSDRDMVLECTTVIDLEGGRVFIEGNSTTEYNVPQHKRYVRIPDTTTTWTIERLGPRKTKVTYTGKSSPGGHIPPGIANWSSGQFCFKTLRGLRDMCKDQRYIDEAKKLLHAALP